jgi:transposase-like protein
MNEAACREALERLRWPEGPVCPRCGSSGPAIGKVGGKSHRPGLYLCSDCRSQFTATVGTPLEGSKLPLSKWIHAAHLLNSHKLVSVREIESALGVTYKTAWHMVQKLLVSVDDYRGPLPKFGKTVQSHVEPLLPKTRNSMSYWKRKQVRMRTGTYKAPRVPEANGALSSLEFVPPPTKAHAERTERFLRWVMEDG